MFILRKLLFICFGFILSFPCEAKVIETAHIADVMPFISEESWFLVDLDNTLFEAKQALGHANWFYDEMQARMQKGMARDDAIRDVYPEWIKTQRVCPVKPLEEQFIFEILALQEKSVVVMGFTHRQPLAAEVTLHQIRSLGIDFTKTAPNKETFTIPSATPTLYTHGVLFVGDYNKKGDIFLPFLQMIQKNPVKVVFIDDKRKNVEELEQALAPLEVEYIGIHYRAIEYTAPVYSPELAQFQYQFIDKIMSNQAAQALMNQGISE